MTQCLLEDYRLVVERRFACPSDPESYASEAYVIGRATHTRQVKE
jgi:hypothetical protein